MRRDVTCLVSMLDTPAWKKVVGLIELTGGCDVLAEALHEYVSNDTLSAVSLQSTQ